MILNMRRNSVCATTQGDVKVLVKVLRSFEREQLVRIALHHMAPVVPIKTLCDALGTPSMTYHRTWCSLAARIKDETREVK